MFFRRDPLPEEWIELYEAAVDIRDLAPWEFMSDTDLFAIESPDGRTGYCSVFGAGGEIFGLTVFLGQLGYETYRRQAASAEEGFSQIDPSELTERLPYALMATFENSSEIESRERKLIRELGLRFRGKKTWPMFRLHEPGYAPWFIDRDDALFLTVVLEEAWGVAMRVGENPDLLVPPDPRRPILTRRMEGEEFVDAWGPEPDPPRRDYPTFDYRKLLADTKLSPSHTEATWQLDYFYLHVAMQERPSARPAFPRVALWVGEDGGAALGTWAGTGDKFLVEAPLKILEAIMRLGAPKRIRVRHRDAAGTILPLARALGIKLEVSSSLLVLDEVKREMQSHLVRED